MEHAGSNETGGSGERADQYGTREFLSEIKPSESVREFFGRKYDELRLIAATVCAEWDTSSLQPTALVHEAFAAMASSQGLTDKKMQGAYVARVMRSRMVDAYRKRHARKRGGGATRPLEFDPGDDSRFSPPGINLELSELDDALEQLHSQHPEVADIVELRLTCGLSIQGIAARFLLPPQTVIKQWRFALAWFRQRLGVALPE